MPLLRLAAAACVALLLAGCPRNLPGGVRCSASGGPEWREYRSHHFVLLTDLDRSTAAGYVAALERFRALELQAWLGEAREVPGVLQVVVPAEELTFRQIAPRGAVGYYRLAALGVPTVVLAPRSLQASPETIAHELAHHLSRFVFPRQARWFSEGMAEFVETVGNPDPRYPDTVGLVPRMRGRRLDSATVVPARELLGWQGEVDDHEWDRHHLYSWLLYHWLWNERGAQLADLQRRLSASEEPAAAWRAAFPEFDPASKEAMQRLDEAIKAHRTKGSLTFYRVKADFDPSFIEARLAPADVHMLFVEVSATGGMVDMEVAEALKEDPSQPAAIAFHARGRPAEARARLRAATLARPSDWRAWLRLAYSLEEADRAEREAAFRQALALEPNSSLVHNELAWQLATHGQAAEALPLARRAVELAPWDASSFDTLARATFELGDCGEALALQRRAVALAGAPPADGPIMKALRTYQARCGGG